MVLRKIICRALVLLITTLTTDTEIIWLYFYLMYLKFGFGRATNVVGTEVRRGAMTRKQAVNLVKKYDGEFPEQFVDSYLEYYKMSLSDFNNTLDKWANKDLLKKPTKGGNQLLKLADINFKKYQIED